MIISLSPARVPSWHDQITLVNVGTLSRESLIEWLCWNDRNGVYSDKDSEAEGLEPLNKDEALQIAIKQLKEA